MEGYGASPPETSAPGSRMVTMGFIVLLLSVSAGMHFGGAGGFGQLLCFAGVLVGGSLVAAGVRMADGPPPIVPMAFGGGRPLAAFVRRNASTIGLVMVSGAITMVAGEEDPVLCFGMLALTLLGLTLINIGARGE